VVVADLRRIVLWTCLALMALAAVPARAQSPYVDDRYPHLFAPRDQRPRIITIPPGLAAGRPAGGAPGGIGAAAA
jgi:hypothetical protein